MRRVAAGLLLLVFLAGEGTTRQDPPAQDPFAGTDVANPDAVRAWFPDKSLPGHKGKEPTPASPEKVDSAPRDPMPIPVPIDPILTKAGIPTATLQAIVQ